MKNYETLGVYINQYRSYVSYVSCVICHTLYIIDHTLYAICFKIVQNIACATVYGTEANLFASFWNKEFRVYFIDDDFMNFQAIFLRIS